MGLMNLATRAQYSDGTDNVPADVRHAFQLYDQTSRRDRIRARHAMVRMLSYSEQTTFNQGDYRTARLLKVKELGMLEEIVAESDSTSWMHAAGESYMSLANIYHKLLMDDTMPILMAYLNFKRVFRRVQEDKDPFIFRVGSFYRALTKLNNRCIIVAFEDLASEVGSFEMPDAVREIYKNRLRRLSFKRMHQIKKELEKIWLAKDNDPRAYPNILS
jgi:hypothetical protein